MESVIDLQFDTYEKMFKAQTNFSKSPKVRITEAYCETRLEVLENLWSEFIQNHRSLVKDYGSELKQHEYCKKEIYELAEEIYLDYKSDLKSKLKSFSVQVNPSTKSKITDFCPEPFKLPKIVIPTFSGKYTEWVTFRDLFTSLIHNNCRLDNVQKIHYLKSSLCGEAEQLLRQIPIAEANYERCWKQLLARYDNKRYLSHLILKRLLSQRNVVAESASSLKELIDTTNDCLNSLGNLGINTSSWDIIIIHILCIRLDPESRKQWEFGITDSTSSEELPTYTKFVEFLTSRYRALEFLEPRVMSGRVNSHGNAEQGNKIVKFKSMHTATNNNCAFCSDAHKLSTCRKFANEAVDSRRGFVQSKGLCYNCLGSNHGAKACLTNIKCKLCHRKHHTLLHPKSMETVQTNFADFTGVESQGRDKPRGETEPSCEAGSSNSSSTVVSCNFSTGTVKQVLLATALVNTESKNGTNYVLRALLDQGSQGNFVTESTVRDLRLRKTPINGKILGVGGEKALISRAVVTLVIKSRLNQSWELEIKAYVLKSITSFLPGRKVDKVDVSEIEGMKLADPDYDRPNKIDLLLGAEVFSRIILEGVRKGSSGSPLAQCTELGWILSGVVHTSRTPSEEINVMHCNTEDNLLLKKFWELEDEIALPKEKMYTEEEKACEDYFTKTTSRDDTGRYIVRLPFKGEGPDVQNSFSIAKKRLYSLEHRLKNEELKNKYTAVINEYIEMKHMELIPFQEINNPKAIYLPHHVVIREDKDTTKARVVFDASCKGSNNLSLNDSSLIGPSLQPELRHTIMSWRTYPICLSADIKKMYRQVKVHDEDVDFQRILWRDDVSAEIDHYRLLRVTFGVASSPYLAKRTLLQMGEDYKEKFPIAAEKITSDFYMDDLMTGCNTVPEGMQLYKEMNEVLAKGGFEIQKWTTNNEELLKEIKKDSEKTEQATDIQDNLKIKSDEITKIVGLTWNRSADSFRYDVKVPKLEQPVTKRKIISDISRFYDPLGWVAPSIIRSKIIIQKLWLVGIEWDEVVPNHILEEWLTYRKELMLLGEITIPRWVHTKAGDRVELHGFCDASKDAYAAVVYVRVIDVWENIHVALITAKTKVAPVKQVSIPRLELCGAVLLTRLMIETSKILRVEKCNMRAWTDSTVVLAWINSHPGRWKVFVANRVSEIQTNLDSHYWSHVSTKENAADPASRGLSPADLVKTEMWFRGPTFLRNKVINYEKTKNLLTDLETVKSHCSVVEVDIWERFSTLTKMKRVVAYCRRFIHNSRVKAERKITGYLSTQELKEALNVCIKQYQAANFQDEIGLLKQNNNLPKTSNLNSLNPMIDNQGIVRVGGRLEHANLRYNRKHPIVIPRGGHLTDLIVTDAHTTTLHGGPQLMLSYLQTKFYILGVKQLVRACFRKCVTCVKNAPIIKQQLMGQLPDARITPARPFLRSGVDFAGPIQIRTAKGRGHKSYKGYICLFVCMATRAVHVEAVSDLTSHGFLQAFKRFVARRGRCEDIWSDNGTNFVGAAAEISKLFSSEKDSILTEIAEQLATNNTTWHFIPPHAPNFGGLWEAGIKSVKFHLKRVIGASTLTYEELSTVLSQVEACLNSRPLSRLSSDHLDTVVTPGHFLVGEPLVTAPDHSYESANVNSLRRWQYTQRMLQDFWQRWSKEYLNQFFHRYRWATKTCEPKIGDIVLIKEDGLPPCRWLYGRVVEQHPGRDGIARVVTLQCKDSFLKRPTNKLCILPIDT